MKKELLISAVSFRIKKNKIFIDRKMDGYAYIDKIKTNGMIKRKEWEWLSNIWVYTFNEKVYKVALQFDFKTLKKAKKSGVNGEWRIFEDQEGLCLDNPKMKIGKMMFKYDVHSKNIDYWTGEDY